MADLTIRSMRLDEIAIAIDWAAGEGWNPGLADAACFASVDADGFLFLRGRADGAILRGGFKLLPETIESALLLHPAVSAVAVVGLSDTRLGQVPAAVVQFKRDTARPAIDELARHLRGHVYATHIPVSWRVVEELPRTASFKVDRRALRDLFETEPVAARVD